MIERASRRWPAVPLTREQRLAQYHRQRDAIVCADELALRRKHGRGVQGGLFPDPRREYAEQAAANAHEVTQEDYENANS